jgi:hypothetical protein
LLIKEYGTNINKKGEVKMGTRAIITMEGKPIIATHWDGYLKGLGEGLLSMPDTSIKTIIKTAEKHCIDFIDAKIGKQVKEHRLQELCSKHNLTIDKIKEGYRKGSIISNDDYEIGNIKIYDDFAEYQYDIRTDGIYFRSLSGCWQESQHTTNKFQKLSTEIINKED